MYNEDIGENQFSPAEIYASAILYFPLLGTSYFIFDLFQTETIEIQDKALQTTEFLNPELPGAQIKDDGIGSKYENMAKSWGKIQDYSAVDNIDREEPDKNKEEYESKYTQDDIDLLTEEQQEKAAAAEIASAKTREQEALAELESTRRGETERANATVPRQKRTRPTLLHHKEQQPPEPSTKRAGL